MKITNVRTILMDASIGFNIDYLFVLIETDEGITGLGEASSWPGCPAIVGVIEEMKPFLIGADPLDIELIYQRLNRRFHYIGIAGVVPTALSGIDIALWDLMGKKLNMPVYQLLGGRCQPEIKVYGNYWGVGLKNPRDVDEIAERAASVVRQGYKALKCGPVRLPGPDSISLSSTQEAIRNGARQMAAIRKAVGDDVELYVELGGKFDVPTAIKIARALEPFRIGFIEEPIGPENPRAMAEVRKKSPIPVAGGERLYGRTGFLPFLQSDALDVLQPDLMRTGGFWESRKIAALAETYYKPVAPHNAGGPVGTIATLHFGLATPNFEILEFRIGDVPWRDTVITPAIKIENGVMHLPEGPGLGIQLNEDIALEHPHKPVNTKAFL